LKKKQVIITLGIMCFILTFAISVQIKTMNAANTTASQSMADNELRDNVLRWKEKYDEIAVELKKAEQNLEKVREEATQGDEKASAKEEELKKNNTLLGLTNVSGAGIIIELEDGTLDNSIVSIYSSTEVLVHNDDLLSIVNELRNAGAEAIEINEQRIINTSSITCEGNIIKINGERIGSPFTIKAIGTQGLLYGQLTRAGSYLSLMEGRGVKINRVEQLDDIKINQYNGIISFKYLNRVK